MFELDCHIDVDNFVIFIVEIFFDVGVNLESRGNKNLLVSISEVGNLVRVLRQID